MFARARGRSEVQWAREWSLDKGTYGYGACARRSMRDNWVEWSRRCPLIMGQLHDVGTIRTWIAALGLRAVMCKRMSDKGGGSGCVYGVGMCDYYWRFVIGCACLKRTKEMATGVAQSNCLPNAGTECKIYRLLCAFTCILMNLLNAGTECKIYRVMFVFTRNLMNLLNRYA